MKINVGARTYSISSVDDDIFDASLLSRGVFIDDIPGVKSFIDYDNQVILVRSRLKQDHKRELVIHELVHACLEDSGVGYKEEHEAFVKVIAPRLNSLLSGLQEIIENV